MNLLDLLKSYQEHDPARVEETMAFLEKAERPYAREQLDGHITGSALVVNPLRTHVLLTHHKKFDKWMQLGGHSDGDSNTRRVAHREAYEESGLPPESIILVQHQIFDMDIHEIPEHGVVPEHKHYDIRFLFEADDALPLIVSDDSHDVAWVEIAALLRDEMLEEGMRRMLQKVQGI